MNTLNCLEGLSFMNRPFRYLVRARGDRDRQLVISGVILTLICLALYINLSIMLSKRSFKESQNPIKNETNETTTYVTNMASTNLPYTISSTKPILSSMQPILSTIDDNLTEIYTNYSLPTPVQYETDSLPLDNSLYCNLMQFCVNDGYINSVSLRLFSEWQGNASLYLFIISSNLDSYEISYRYAIKPERNTTEWQTIQIPAHASPVRVGNLLAIGMQESSGHKNQIYAVKLDFGVNARNVNENTTILTAKLDYNIGVAIGFTLIHYV